MGLISTLIEGTEDAAFAAQEAIALALCPPDADHPGQCPVPWSMLMCRFDDLGPEQRAAWEAEFAKDRRRARALGGRGA